MRLGEWNPDEFAFPRLYYYAYKQMFMVASDPRTIIGGSIIILNFANVGSSQVLKDPNVIRAMVRFSQEALPGRVKRVILYNEGKIINTALSIFTFYMKDKAKSRMLNVGSDISKAYEVEPGLKAIIPPEYGGDGKSLAELIKDNRGHFYEFYGQGDPTSEIKVDESKRPVSARAYLREYKDYDPNVMGTSGIFIKINQDEI
ncbi:unnamed protein product [Mesocestoides corti]|uniref:CRAL-TRIO domain-containing protein n=2 Tax=Mesocestoides corti TaxID=53468 RepID=A0A3P6H8Y9_MESCO|nr:unnamed protein product [Mesocestoides corti]